MSLQADYFGGGYTNYGFTETASPFFDGSGGASTSYGFTSTAPATTTYTTAETVTASPWDAATTGGYASNVVTAAPLQVGAEGVVTKTTETTKYIEGPPEVKTDVKTEVIELDPWAEVKTNVVLPSAQRETVVQQADGFFGSGNQDIYGVFENQPLVVNQEEKKTIIQERKEVVTNTSTALQPAPPSYAGYSEPLYDYDAVPASSGWCNFRNICLLLSGLLLLGGLLGGLTWLWQYLKNRPVTPIVTPPPIVPVQPVLNITKPLPITPLQPIIVTTPPVAPPVIVQPSISVPQVTPPSLVVQPATPLGPVLPPPPQIIVPEVTPPGANPTPVTPPPLVIVPPEIKPPAQVRPPISLLPNLNIPAPSGNLPALVAPSLIVKPLSVPVLNETSIAKPTISIQTPSNDKITITPITQSIQTPPQLQSITLTPVVQTVQTPSQTQSISITPVATTTVTTVAQAPSISDIAAQIEEANKKIEILKPTSSISLLQNSSPSNGENLQIYMPSHNLTIPAQYMLPVAGSSNLNMVSQTELKPTVVVDGKTTTSTTFSSAGGKLDEKGNFIYTGDDSANQIKIGGVSIPAELNKIISDAGQAIEDKIDGRTLEGDFYDID